MSKTCQSWGNECFSAVTFSSYIKEHARSRFFFFFLLYKFSQSKPFWAYLADYLAQLYLTWFDVAPSFCPSPEPGFTDFHSMAVFLLSFLPPFLSQWLCVIKFNITSIMRNHTGAGGTWVRMEVQYSKCTLCVFVGAALHSWWIMHDCQGTMNNGIWNSLQLETGAKKSHCTLLPLTQSAERQ